MNFIKHFILTLKDAPELLLYMYKCFETPSFQKEKNKTL